MPLLDSQGRRFVTDHEKAEIIRASMLNLGRLLALDMELRFYRTAAAGPVHMDITWPDGTTLSAKFTGCSPVYHVPMVNAVDGVLDELEV
ncbi:hypothetical protein [Thauera sp.]|uniref:hypothetical protein n=1 Tax=Thauera sp. TaxID=1905334 RepID=UPI0039E5AEF1